MSTVDPLDEGSDGGATYDDPNREAVGLAPIWTGAPGEPEPAVTPQDDAPYDPGEHTVAEVEQYIVDHPDEAEAVLDAEESGRNRTSLTGG